MNYIVVYCTVKLGYLEYKIQLGKERKKQNNNNNNNNNRKTVKVI